MRKIFYSSCLLVIVFVGGFDSVWAQSAATPGSDTTPVKSTPAKKPAPLDARTHSLVWEIRRGKKLGYLAGTIHILRDQDQIPPIYQELYNKSKTIVFEADVRDINLEESGFMARDPNWISSMSPKTQRAFDEFCTGDMGEFCELLSVLSPGIFCVFANAQIWEKIGANSEKGVDRQFMEQAFEDDKVVGWLEEPQRQLHLVNQIDDDHLDHFVRGCLDSATEDSDAHQRSIRLLEQMISAFVANDARKLAQILAEESERFEQSNPGMDYYMHNIINRHSAWIPEFDKMLSKPGPVLFLVGAAHLGGENSLVELLKKDGYSVRPLPAPDNRKATNP